MTHRVCMAVAAVLSFFCGVGECSDELVRNDRPLSWREDAELTDVFFLNQQLGWAVGAQGVILRTTDGGEHWTQYSSVTSKTGFGELSLAEKIRNARTISRSAPLKPNIFCRFESIHFVDPLNGWVAGGFEAPFGNRSHGVLFLTRDGGVTWKQMQGLLIPSLKKVRFSDVVTGWAIAKTSNLYPTGLLITNNGGMTWSSNDGNRNPHLISGDKTAKGFVVIDGKGQPARVENGQLSPSSVVTRKPVALESVLMSSAKRGVAVGSNGAFYRTETSGEVWMSAAPADQRDAIQDFDFHALAQVGDQAWFAGNPGTRLFRYDTRTKELVEKKVPGLGRIHGMSFIDEKTGWLVGDWGTILSTRDGGESWQRQRGKQSRMALLLISETAETLPLDMIAKYGGEQAHLVAAITGNSGNPLIGAAAVRDATERIGGCSVEVVRRSQLDLKRLCRSIRMFRPSVVLSDDGPEFQQTLRLAVAAAADPLSFPEQLAVAGLKVWQVDRLALRDRNGSLSISPKQMLAGGGKSIEDQVSVSRALLGHAHTVFSGGTAQSSLKKHYHLRALSLQANHRASKLFESLDGRGSGLPTRAGGSDRRGNLELIRRVSQKQSALDRMVAWPAAGSDNGLAWRSSLVQIVEPLPDESAGIWLVQLAEMYREAGKSVRAADTLQYLVNRYPQHAFSLTAKIWLVHHQTSSEFGVLTKPAYDLTLASQRQAKKASHVPTTIQKDGVTKTVWLPTQTRGNKVADEVQATAAAAVTPTLSDWAALRQQTASQLLSRLRSGDPEMAIAPELRLVEAQISRRQNGGSISQNQFRQLGSLKTESASRVAMAALRELSLDKADEVARTRPSPEGQPNATANDFEADSWFIPAAPSRPHLDGLLDDPVWAEVIARQQTVIARHERGLENRNGDQILLARDEQFLYVGIRCAKIAGQLYAKDDSPRTRDPDLARQDRVEFALDLDRDYTSAFRFVVDHRGWVAEDCSGFKSWNPAWYVKTSSDEEYWCAEIAIPFEELGAVPSGASVWALQMRRNDYASKTIWSTRVPAKMREAGTAKSQRGGLSTAEVDSTFCVLPGVLHSLQTRPEDYRLLKFR